MRRVATRQRKRSCILIYADREKISRVTRRLSAGSEQTSDGIYTARENESLDHGRVRSGRTLRTSFTVDLLIHLACLGSASGTVCDA